MATFRTLAPGPSAAGAQDRGVRALDRLDGDHGARAHDQGLSDPERGDRLRERPAEGEIGELLAARGDAPVGARRRDQLRHELGLRQQADALLRQMFGDTGEDRRVVTVGQTAQSVSASGVGAQRRRVVERELRELAGQHRLADAGRAQRCDDPTHLARIQPVERRDLGLERGIGLPRERHGHDRARAPARRARDLERQPAAPRDQAERRQLRRGHG